MYENARNDTAEPGETDDDADDATTKRLVRYRYRTNLFAAIKP